MGTHTPKCQVGLFLIDQLDRITSAGHENERLISFSNPQRLPILQVAVALYQLLVKYSPNLAKAR